MNSKSIKEITKKKDQFSYWKFLEETIFVCFFIIVVRFLTSMIFSMFYSERWGFQTIKKAFSFMPIDIPVVGFGSNDIATYTQINSYSLLITILIVLLVFLFSKPKFDENVSNSLSSRYLSLFLGTWGCFFIFVIAFVNNRNMHLEVYSFIGYYALISVIVSTIIYVQHIFKQNFSK